MQRGTEPMRVLHIAAGNLYGGVETFLVTLARFRQSAPALEQEFALCFDGRLRSELAAAGASVHSLGAVRVRQPISIWKARHRLRAILNERRTDVVVCHMAWPYAIFAPVVRGSERSLVFWLHMATDGSHWLERWARMTAPDLAIAPSRFVAETLPTLFPRVDAHVIHYAVAAPDGSERIERSKVRAELNTPADSIVIVQACRLEQWKGQAVHLRALAELRDLPGWICWMVGGAQRPHEMRFLGALKAQASELGITERVRFAGQRADVPRVLAAADIYCQPNTGLEGLPIIFTEALDAGLPIVTTDIGGFDEIVDDSCGIRVAPDDSAAAAGALRSLVTDPLLRKRLGAAGPARARSLCDPGSQIQAMKTLFDELSGNREDDGIATAHSL
ncbi:MAG: glycosyltransferase [Candidatus Binatus sp.]